jgi:hypothetical protein
VRFVFGFGFGFGFFLAAVLAPGAAIAQQTPQTPAACEKLASLSLPATAITLRWRARSVRFRTCLGE